MATRCLNAGEIVYEAITNSGSYKDVNETSHHNISGSSGSVSNLFIALFVWQTFGIT